LRSSCARRSRRGSRGSPPGRPPGWPATHDGGSAIDPVVVEHLLRRRQADNLLAALTSREREVLGGMAEGRSNQSIANSLFVSEKTVEACTGRIFAKLGLEPGPD